MGLKASVYISVCFGLTGKGSFKVASAERRMNTTASEDPQQWGRGACCFASKTTGSFYKIGLEHANANS